MAKKIKISESQYNTLQKYLVETPYDEVYKSIKVDDIIEIENKGNISKYKVMYFGGNQNVVLSGVTPNVNKYYFAMNKNDFYNGTLKARFIPKDEFIANRDIDTWKEYSMNITSFKLIRNNSIIDTVDINDSTQEPEEPQTPQGDVVSEPIDLNPKNTSPEAIAAEKDEEDKKEAAKKEAEIKAAGQRALEAIINDKDLQAAFYRQPSFWKLFVADMTGTKAVGKGIVPTVIGLVNRYKNKETNEKAYEDFKRHRIADFSVLELVEIIATGDQNPFFAIEPNVDLNATVQDYFEPTTGNVKLVNNKISPDRPNGFSMYVRGITNEENVYLCDFETTRDEVDKVTDTRIKNKYKTKTPVKVRFNVSAGYIPQKNK